MTIQAINIKSRPPRQISNLNEDINMLTKDIENVNLFIVGDLEMI